MKSEKEIQDILKENERRRKEINAPFDPISGCGSIGEREKFTIKDFPIPTQWLPVEMMEEPLVKELKKAKSLDKLCGLCATSETEEGYNADILYEYRDAIIEQFVRIRIKYDFAFWAATLVYIKRKGGGDDCLFRLNRPQRRLVARLEKMRKAGKPIRLILLKARQWGGSTCIQLYMAWLQLVHEVGLNSLIIALQNKVSDEIKDMFDKMISLYPVRLLHEMGDAYSENEPKLVGVGKSGDIHRVPQRKCKIKIGSMQRPDSCRGGDYNLVHLSEVGLWKTTEGKSPEDVVRGATSGVLLRPLTMIVYESTANGVGNFFYDEYQAAVTGKSQFEPMFVAWYEIEQYEMEFETARRREEFARWLWENRKREDAESDREEPGKYLWWLWEKGATLEAINWYIVERKKYTDHGDMASEFPSDDDEAFTFSGRKVFEKEDVEQFKAGCRPPKWRGEIYGRADEGATALEGLRFRKEENGQLYMWHDVEKDDETTRVIDRYLVVVDVCKGHTKNADYADILVLDRLPMIDGEGPVVCAEWHGHIDMDKLAWKAAQVAAYYNNALLVIESNTLETNKTAGEAEYILTLIADVYSNLYARKQSAEDIQAKIPKKYGFHTNTLTKKVVIYNLKVAVREHLYVEREKDCLNEYLTYIETENGGYEAKEGCHDDRLMTRAIGLHICFNEMDMPKIIEEEAKMKRGTNHVVSEATIW